jgi:hypothetical protein
VYRDRHHSLLFIIGRVDPALEAAVTRISAWRAHHAVAENDLPTLCPLEQLLGREPSRKLTPPGLALNQRGIGR